MKRKPYPSDLSDREWAVLAPFFPEPPTVERPRTHSWRELFNAMRYVARTGCAWRSLPHDLPHWMTVYTYFRQWRESGFLAQLHDVLRDAARRKAGRQAKPSADSRRANRQDGGKRGPRGYDAGKKMMGRKRHILVDTLGFIHYLYVTPADVLDRAAAYDLLEVALAGPDEAPVVFADGGYAGDLVDWANDVFGARLEIVRKLGEGFVVLAKRWIVERTFAWLMKQRRLRADYEALPETTETWIALIMLGLYTRRLAET
jgi:putative transposase